MKLEKMAGRSIQTALFGALSRSAGTALEVIALLLALALPAHAGQAAGPGGKRGVETMAVNLYIGAGTERIVALDTADPNYLSNLVYTVTGVYWEVVASQPNVRIGRVADEIVARMPDIVSVEEGTLVRVQSPGDLIVGGSTPATNVVFDYVQILVGALEARGAHYAVKSESLEWDVELPMLNLETGGIDDVRQTDREAILVRTDLPPGQLRVSNPHSGHFTNLLAFPSVGLKSTRGWCSVDAFIRGQVFRFISTHLEEETAPAIQVLQAAELLDGPAATKLPVIVVGDFNTDPLHRDGTTAYDAFPAAGFHDTWATLNQNDPTGGLTWGHDEFLADPTHLFDRRIDFVFYRGGSFVPQSCEVTDLWLGRTLPPLWSSDHAEVSAGFLFR